MPEDFILKNFDSEVKAVEGERALNVTITTKDVDRMGDIVEPKGAKMVNYKKNPVVLMAHDYHGLPIGKAKDLNRTDIGITAKVIFPDEGVYPLADTVYNLYKQKFMKAWSIGFMPISTEDIVDDDKDKPKKGCGKGRRFKTWELLEFSACAVPCNPNALTNMVEKGINVKPLEEAGFIEIEDKAIDNEDLTKEICPVCGADVHINVENNHNYCTICDWNDIEKDEKEEVDEKEEIEDEGEIIKFEYVEKPYPNEHACRIKSPGLFQPGSFRRMTRKSDGKKYSIIMGRLKGETTLTEQAYRYGIKVWTVAQAKKHCKDHDGILFEPATGKAEKDEKDESFICDALIDRITVIQMENKELKEKLKDIELKAGAVLNVKNKKDLKDAQRLNQEADALIQSVLDSATTGEEDSLEITDEEGEDSKGDNTVVDLVTNTVDNPPIDKKEDEDKMEVDEKVIAEIIDKHMNYIVGKLEKSDT